MSTNDARNQTTEAREAFEVWAKARGMYAHRRDGYYPDSAARFAWDAWIAAWTQALLQEQSHD